MILMCAAPLITCRHCGERKKARARGLCSLCHRRLNVRRQFGPVSVYGNRMTATEPEPGKPSLPLPPCPTDAMPGSAEKIAVLKWRMEKGYLLWHPGDRRIDLR